MRKAVKIALMNQKGGVGKSTSTINMSSALVEKGYKVLVIDVDSQSNTSYAFGLITPNSTFGLVVENLTNSIYEVFTKNLPLEKAIHKTEFGVDVVPSSMLFANAELEIASKMNRESILKNALNKANLDYDFILLDLPPNLGLLTLNGLVCADHIFIPVNVGIFALSGIDQLISVIQLLKDSGLNENIDILGVLLTQADDRTKLTKQIYSVLKDIFKDKVFETRIHQNVTVAESQISQQPINYYSPKDRAAEEYMSLIEEVLERVNG